MNYHDIRQGYAGFFESWDWELHVTLSFDRRLDFRSACMIVKRWLKDYRHRFWRIKFAGIMILSNPHDEYPHVHMLLTSDQRYPNTLSNMFLIELKFVELTWREQEGTCKITKGWNNETICRYVSNYKNIILWDPDKWELELYRPKVLEQLRVR